MTVKQMTPSVYRRDLYDVLVAWIDKEAKGWPPYPMHISGPEYPATPVPMLPATVVEAIIEAWLVDTYLPAILRGGAA